MKLTLFDTSAIAPVADAPAPARVLSGSPTSRTWNFEDDGQGLYAGVWEAMPGVWQVEYTEWEFCHIISGVSVLTAEDGTPQQVQAGDSFVIPRGFKGTWNVLETTLKHYVIKE
jgi:uncharacterized cupin superfamily protein